MANRFKHIARRRRDFTNESYCQALGELRLLSSETPIIPTASPGQAGLEVEVLEKIGYGIKPQGLHRGTRHPFGIRSVTPRRDELEISLPDEKCFANFVSRVSPVLHDDHIATSGVPGLRVSFSRSGAALHRIHSPGKVILKGIDKSSWKTALDHAFEDPTVLREQYLGSAQELHEVEEFEITNYTYACDSKHHTDAANLILSGFLRRVHMFRARSQMRFTDLWFNFYNDGAVINLEWSGDLPHIDLIRRITDRRLGLPLKLDEYDRCLCEPCTANTYGIGMRDTLSGTTSVQLRWSSLHADELPKRKTGPCQFVPGGSAESPLKQRGVESGS